MKMAGALVLLVLLGTGCSFSFFESETALEPIPLEGAADRVAVEDTGATSDAITAAAILKLLPIKEFFTGEGQVRRDAIAANKAAGVGVRIVTRRRFLNWSF